MKHKRIIAFLTLLTVILSIPQCIYAQNNMSESGEELVCKSFLTQLGVDNGINPDLTAFITRAEFVAMTVRIMNADVGDASDIIFTDCSANVFAPEINTAQKLGISNGTSAGIFSPDAPVGKNAAAKVIVTALGHNAEAEAVGGYPSGYLKKASELGVFDSIGTASDKLTVKEAFIIMYNSLRANVAIVRSVEGGFLETVSIDGKNLLTEKFKLTSSCGVVTTAGHRGVSVRYAGENNIEINGEVFKADFDTSLYIGKSVELWYDNNKNTMAVDVLADNSEVVVNGGDIVDCDGNTVEIYENDHIKKYKLSRALIFMENGRAIAHTEDSFFIEDGFMRFIDNNGDRAYDFVICEKPEYFVISGIDSINSIIYDENSLLKSVCLEADVDFERIVEIDGVRADIDSLSKGMSLEVMMSSDGGVCEIRAVKESGLKGVVTEIGDGEITVDNKIYKLNSYFIRNGFSIKPGVSYSFILAPNGSVTALSSDASSDIKYGYFLNYAVNGGMNSNVIVRILNDKDAKQTFELDKKITFNGTVVEAESEQIRKALMNNSIPRYQLIRYKLSNGKIVMIDTSVSDTVNWNVSAVYPEDDSLVLYMNKKSVQYKSGVSFAIPNVSFNSATIFSVPKLLATEPDRVYDEDFFRAKGNVGLIDNNKYTVDAYDFDETYLPAAVVMYTETDTAALTSPSNTETSYMVKSVSNTLNAEGEETIMIRALGGGKFIKYYVDPELCSIFRQNDKIPNPGDVVRFSRNTSGEVNGIARDVMYDSANHKLTVRYNYDSLAKASNAWFTYFSGYAVSARTGFLTLRLTNTPEDPETPDDIMTLPVSSAKYVIYNKTTGEVRSGDASSVVTENYAGEGNGSLVTCMSNYFSVKTVFIYTE